MKFAYTRRGGPLLNWSGPTAPYQSRAGETRSLGSLGDLNVPRPGAPEIVSGYESPEPGAATIHLGGYMPEGAAHNYGQAMIGADAPTLEKAPFDLGLIRKAAVLAAAYHGVKRNNGSVLWGLLWAGMAYISPLYGVLVPAIGVAQGFGQPKLRNNPAKRKKRGRRTAARLGWARRRRHGTGRIPANVARRKRRHRKMAKRIAAADWSPSGLRRAGFLTRPRAFARGTRS
jgi:hypothetical protein